MHKKVLAAARWRKGKPNFPVRLQYPTSGTPANSHQLEEQNVSQVLVLCLSFAGFIHSCQGRILFSLNILKFKFCLLFKEIGGINRILWDREPQLPIPALKVASLLAFNQEEKGMNRINTQGAITLTFHFHSMLWGIELMGTRCSQDQSAKC